MKEISKKSENKPKHTHKTTPKSPKKSPARKILGVLGRIVLAFFCFLILSGLAAGIYFYRKTPPVEKLTSSQIAQTSIIYDRTGEHVLYEIHGEENRQVISHEEIPNVVRQATLAAEDGDFYSHPGIDAKAILRALKTDVGSSQMQQGASTITQQLARNVFLTREKTFERKILEVVLAIKIERIFQKDEILDMYINDVPYGSNAYGIQKAARTFFGKDAKDLSLDEAALLSALPNATTFFSPYGTHSDDLNARKNYVIDRMQELKMISVQAAAEAKSQDTLSKIVPLRREIDAPHFVFFIKDQLEKTYGKEKVEQGGLRVYSTLDYDMQKLAEKAVSDNINSLGAKYGAKNAALVSVDPKTGEVLAMVGSKDYFNKSIDGQVNVATSPRQPGSSFKPFAYAAAFEAGYQPETMIYDLPTDFGPDGSGNNYTPSNYDGSFHGLVSMRQALCNSLNIPAVKTLYLAGINSTINLAKNLGITTLNDRNRYGLALVLGGGEVTLLDETSAYSVFANDGKRNPQNSILKIENAFGETVFEKKSEEKQVISSQVARKVDSVLSDNKSRSMVFGTNSKLYIPGRTVAAKTGTTQEFHDAWTVGFTPSLAAGVWVGNNDNTAMTAGADGSYVAAPIWNQFMSEALKRYPEESFPDYDRSDIQNISKGSLPQIVYVNKNSGKELSDKKRKKTDPEKIGVKIKYPENWGEGMALLFPELQDTNDPMIQRWKDSLQNPENLAMDNSKKD